MFWPIKRKKYLEELAIISSQINGKMNLFSNLSEKIDNLMLFLQKTNEKIDMILEILQKKSKISPVETKRKEEILSILKEKNALSVYKISNLMGLSRTRCNELLKSLEEEGMVESLRIGKKKIYRIPSHIS